MNQHPMQREETAASKDRRLVILGDTAFAQIAREYFEHESRYRVVAFSVERAYLRRDNLDGLPVIAFEELERHLEPAAHYFYAATVYTQLNRLRARFYRSAKEKGYSPASFVSPRAFVWSNVELGEHCFIFENNVVQPFVRLGNNVVLWSGNHIGHHSVIEDNCFVSSHVVASGFTRIGESSFIGVNATIANNVTVGRDNWIGPGVVISKDTQPDSLYGPPPAEPSRVTATRFFKVGAP